jgi:hypothetical protein
MWPSNKAFLIRNRHLNLIFYLTVILIKPKNFSRMQNIPTRSAAHQAPYSKGKGSEDVPSPRYNDGCVVFQSPSKSFNFTNVCSYALTYTHVVVTCTGTNIPLPCGQHNPCTLRRNPGFCYLGKKWIFNARILRNAQLQRVENAEFPHIIASGINSYH